MANASYDTLTITINADSKKANQSINALSKNLQRLDDTAKNLNTRRIGEVKGLLLNIAKIDFTNVSKGLQDVVSAFKSFQNKAFMKATNGGTNLTPVDPSRVGGASGGASGGDVNFEPISQIDDVKKAFEEVNKEIEDTTNALNKAGFSAEQVKSVLTSIKNSKKVFSEEEVEKLRDTLQGLGIDGKKAETIIKNIKKETEQLGKKGSKHVRSLGKQFQNILKYRIIRKIIQEIYKAFTDGVSNVASFDKDTLEALAQIKASLGYITNSIGSALAPALQMLQPLISSIADGIAEAGTMIAELFATLNGQTQFAQAKKDVDAYRNALKKTQALGIDELNVFQKDTASFEYVDVQQVDNFAGIKESISKIADFVKKIMDMLKPVTEKLLPQIAKIVGVVFSVIEEILPIVVIIVDLVNEFVLDTCEQINGFVVDLLGFVKEIVVFIKNILTVLKPNLDLVLDIVAVVINKLFGILRPILNLLTFIFDVINSVFELLSPIFDVTSDIFSCVGDIFGLFGGLLMPLQLVGDILKDVLAPVFEKIKGFVEKIKAVLEQWFAPVKKVVDAVKGFVGNGVDKVKSGISDFFGKVGGKVSSWFSGLFSGSFATGGFPEDGFFYANHGELVGQFANGQTAVANNDQIIEGIKRGVMEAMEQSGGANVTVYLDSREIATKVEKRMNNKGATIITGGTLSYGK